MKAAETKASKSRWRTDACRRWLILMTAEIDTFAGEVSTTRTNIAMAGDHQAAVAGGGGFGARRWWGIVIGQD